MITEFMKAHFSDRPLASAAAWAGRILSTRLAAEKPTPTNAVSASIHFHSGGNSRSISRMPSAKRDSMMMGSDNK